MLEPLISAAASEVDVELLGGADSLLLLLIAIAGILAAATGAGHVALKLGQPEILGELVAGALLGAFLQFLLPGQLRDLLFLSTRPESHLAILGELGILLLLFRVGLESRPRDLLGVGVTSLLVAIGGVLLPLGMGYLVCSSFSGGANGPGTGWQMHLFVGASMAATSVGVTASVLSEMRRLQSRESQIILGAAIIDDILGLLLLAIVTGVITDTRNGSESSLALTVVSVALSATAFIVAGMVGGAWIARRYLGLLNRIEGPGAHTAGLLAFCLLFSATAELAGLAPIVGAFLAGLVIDDGDTSSTDDIACDAGAAGRAGRELAPLTTILAPIFFVLMGMQVRLDSLFSPDMALYTVAISAVAFAGKFAVGFAVPGSLSTRGFVGAGMVPRGEVGLIFAAIGRSMGAISEETFSALVFMVILTTLVAPPLLNYFERGLDTQ